jgi:hypothetical protein
MSGIYQIHLYDESNATKLAVLLRATRIRFTREIRGTGDISFELPSDDEQLPQLQLGRFVRVHDLRDDTDAAAGFIAGALDLGAEARRPFVRVRAYGAATRLAFLRFPPGYLLKGTLSANRDRFVQQYDWRRITAEDTNASGALGDEVLSFDGAGSGNQLAAFSNTESVDRSAAGETYEEKGAVVLTQSGNLYNSSGTYTTPFIDFRSAPTTFDRLRYIYRQETGTIQYRINSYANLTDTRTFSGAPASDADARGVGVDISGLTARRYIAVELTLATNRADETPIVEAVEVIARRAVAGVSAAGTWPATELGVLRLGGLTLLRALERLCALFALEYRARTDGVVEVQGRPAAGAVGSVWGTDRRDAYTLVEGKHLNISRCLLDDGELANYVVALGTGQGSDQLACVVQDATSQTAYGVRQAVVHFNRPTLADLKTDADAYLSEHKDPQTSLEAEVLATPDGTAGFAPGDLIRVVSPWRKDHEGNDLDETVRIVRETREETESGERILLYGETKPRAMTQDLVERMSDTWEEAQAGVKLYETGRNWSPIYTDGLEHTLTVALPFTPESADATILEVEQDPGGTPAFYTAHGGNIEVRITAARVGTNKMTYSFKRVSGTLDYRVLVRWEAWGAQRAAVALG